MEVTLTYATILDDGLSIEDTLRQAIYKLKFSPLTNSLGFDLDNPINGVKGGIVEYTLDGRVRLTGTYPPGG